MLSKSSGTVSAAYVLFVVAIILFVVHLVSGRARSCLEPAGARTTQLGVLAPASAQPCDGRRQVQSRRNSFHVLWWPL